MRAAVRGPAQLTGAQDHLAHGAEEAIEGVGADAHGRRGLVHKGFRARADLLGRFFGVEQGAEQGVVAVVGRDNRC